MWRDDRRDERRDETECYNMEAPRNGVRGLLHRTSGNRHLSPEQQAPGYSGIFHQGPYPDTSAAYLHQSFLVEERRRAMERFHAPPHQAVVVPSHPYASGYESERTPYQDSIPPPPSHYGSISTTPMSRRDGNTSMPLSHPMAINGYESTRTHYTSTTDPNMHMYVARMQAARNNIDGATMLPGKIDRSESRHQQQQRKPTQGGRHRYDEIYDSVFAPHSRTPTEARTGSMSTARTGSSGRSSSSTESGEEWEENIMSALNDMAGNLKKIGGIQCNQAGPDATEVQLKLNLPVPMNYMDQLGVDAKQGFNSAMASLSPKKCSFQYNDLDGQVVDMEERFLGTIDQLQGSAMPMYKSLFESQSGSTDDEGGHDSRSRSRSRSDRRGHGRAGSHARRAMADEDDDSESNYDEEPFLDRSPMVPVLDHSQATGENLPRQDDRDVRQMRPSLMKRLKLPQTKVQNAAFKRTDDSPIPSEIVISDQPSDISSNHSWQLTSPCNYNNSNNNETTKKSVKERAGPSSHHDSRQVISADTEITDKGMPSFDEAIPGNTTLNDEKSKMEISKALATISNALAKTATPIHSSPWIAATKGKLEIVDRDSPTSNKEGPSEERQPLGGPLVGVRDPKKATPKTLKAVPRLGGHTAVPMDVECANHGDSDGWNSILESCSDLTMDLGAVPIPKEVVMSPKEIPGVKLSFSGDELMRSPPSGTKICREEASPSNSARQSIVHSQAVATMKSVPEDIRPKTGLLLRADGSPREHKGGDESTTSKVTSKPHMTPELVTSIPSPPIEDTDELMGRPKSQRLDSDEVVEKVAVTQSFAVEANKEPDEIASICRSSKDKDVGDECLKSLKDSGKDGGIKKSTSTPPINGTESNPIASVAVPDPANPKLQLLPTQKAEAESDSRIGQTETGTYPKHEIDLDPKPSACPPNKALKHKPKDSDELRALPSVSLNLMVTVLSDEMPDDELMGHQKAVTGAGASKEGIGQQQQNSSFSVDVPEDEMMGVGRSDASTSPVEQVTKLPQQKVESLEVIGGPKNGCLDDKSNISVGIAFELKASLSEAPSFGYQIDKRFDAIPAEANRYLKPMQNEITVTPSSSDHSFRSANEDAASEGSRRADSKDAPLDNPSYETRNSDVEKLETISPRNHPNREALYQMQGFDEYRKNLEEGIVEDRIDTLLACAQSDVSLKDGDKVGKCAEDAALKEENEPQHEELELSIDGSSDRETSSIDDPSHHQSTRRLHQFSVNGEGKDATMKEEKKLQRKELELSIDGSSDQETSSIKDPSHHQLKRMSYQFSVNGEGYHCEDDHTLSQKTDSDDYSSDDEGSFEGRESEGCSVDEENGFDVEAADAKSEVISSQKSLSAPRLRSEIDIEAEQVEIRYLSQHTRSLHHLSSGATVSTTETPGTMKSMVSFRTRDVTAQSRTSSAQKSVPVSYSTDTPMTAQLTTSFTNDTPLAAPSTVSAMRTFDQDTLQVGDSNDIISILSSMHSKKNADVGVASAALAGPYRRSKEGNGLGTSDRHNPMALLSWIQNALTSIFLCFVAWWKHILGLATQHRPTKIGFSQEQLRFQTNMVLRPELLHTRTRSRKASHSFHRGEEVGTCLESIVPDLHMSNQNVEVLSVSSSRSSSRVLKQAYSAISGTGNLRRRRKAAPRAERDINWLSRKDLDDMDDETILSYLD